MYVINERAASWQNRASEAEGLLETVEQPTKYMIDSIRSKDGEIESLRSAQHRLVAKTEALERACRYRTYMRVVFFLSCSRLLSSLFIFRLRFGLCPPFFTPFDVSGFVFDLPEFPSRVP